MYQEAKCGKKDVEIRVKEQSSSILRQASPDFSPEIKHGG